MKLLGRHRNDPIVHNCLELLTETAEIRFDNDCILPLGHAINVYSTRARNNNNLNEAIINGYDTLLPALENAGVPSVKLYSLELIDRWFVIFTDEATSRLFGVLNCPKRKAAWFQPETGYD